MRILLVHNAYRHSGGEDRVVETEAQMLRERGHEVLTYIRQNPDHGVAVLRLAGQAFWNQTAYLELRRLIHDTKPHIVHLHNTFPLISPAALYAARRECVPTVQTLHNYRLLCPNGLFLRDEKPCEDCMNKSAPWPAILHACYRNSYAASAVAAGTLAMHRARATWRTQVDWYIALTEFSRQKFIVGGLPAERISVKPHVVHPDPRIGSGDGGFALFVGRLSHEKGIETLLAAWRRLAGRMQLVIVGDGPLGESVRRAAAATRAISWVGKRSFQDVQELLGRATFVIVPSICYETFGLVVAEAYAKGTPVLAAKLGALEELVEDGRTGFLFTPGDCDDLARQVELILECPAALKPMRKAARSKYERFYRADSNYTMLLRVYTDAITAADRMRSSTNSSTLQMPT